MRNNVWWKAVLTGIVLIVLATTMFGPADSSGEAWAKVEPPTEKGTPPAPHQSVQDHAEWEEVGEGSASGGWSCSPSLAIAPNDTPYVAWCHETQIEDAEIYIRYWNGTEWEEIGGSASGGGVSSNDGQSYSPSLAIAPDETVYVAWSDSGSGIYVKRWNGSEWVEVGVGSASGGGISDTTHNSEGPSLAIAPDGTPYVAWSDHQCDKEDCWFDVYIKRWDGTEWKEVGVGSASGGGISNTGRAGLGSLDIAPDGTPYVAWCDDSHNLGNPKIYVRRWNGSYWEAVGTGSVSGEGIGTFKLAIAPNGTPYVAW